MKRQKLMALISVFAILFTACSAADKVSESAEVKTIATEATITTVAVSEPETTTTTAQVTTAVQSESTALQSSVTSNSAPAKNSETTSPNVTANDKNVLAEGVSDPDKYKSYCPGVIEAEFVVIDTKKNYDTGFECWLEKYENGKWSVVKPLGEIEQANNGTGHFYNINEEGRDFVRFDLACYPLLSAGKYRVAKPFWEKGSSNHKQYICYAEFSMVDGLNTGSKIGGSVSAACKEYPVNTPEIKLNISYESGAFAKSSIIDLEKKANGKWVSVRKGSVDTNSIGGSYALGFKDIEEIDTGNFDVSTAGEYRARVSVGGIDMSQSSIDFEKNYDTKYAYFLITANADMGNITAKLVKTDICEVDHKFSVQIDNNGSVNAKLSKAELKVKTSDGKTQTIPCNTNGTKMIWAGDSSEISIMTDKDLPVGNAELKLTLSAEGCKDKLISVNFNIRKATDEERNSGVFITTDKSSYAPSPSTITVTITNKLRSKQTIYIEPWCVQIGTEKAPAYLFPPADKFIDCMTIEYGKSVKITYTNYGDNLVEYVKLLAKSRGGELTDEDLSEINKDINDLKSDPLYAYSCLKEKGKYFVIVSYATEESLDSDYAECSFNIS